MDTRYEFYGEAFIKTAIRTQQRALYDPQVLNEWGVNFWLLKKEDLISRPESRADWVLVYEDDQALLYQHLSKKEASRKPD